MARKKNCPKCKKVKIRVDHNLCVACHQSKQTEDAAKKRPICPYCNKRTPKQSTKFHRKCYDKAREESQSSYLAWGMMCDHCKKEIPKTSNSRRHSKRHFCSKDCQYDFYRLHSNKILGDEGKRQHVFRDIFLPINNVLVTACWHVPLHNVEFCLKLLEFAKKFKIEYLIVLGDFVDFQAFSYFLPYTKRTSAREDLYAASEVVRAVSARFKMIYIFAANHEYRMAKRFHDADIDDPFGFFAEIADAFIAGDNVKFFIDNQCVIKSGGQEIRLMHPSSYSQIAPQNERYYAELYRQHVVGAHGHLFAKGFEKSAINAAIQIGHMSDRAKHAYLHYQPKRYPNWMNAFVWIKDGTIMDFCNSPIYTNWDFWLKGIRLENEKESKKAKS